MPQQSNLNDIIAFILEKLDLNSLGVLCQADKQLHSLALQHLFTRRTTSAIMQQKKWLQMVVHAHQAVNTPLGAENMWEWLQRNVLTEEDFISGLLFIAAKKNIVLQLDEKIFLLFFKEFKNIFSESDTSFTKFPLVLSTLKIIAPVLKNDHRQKLLAEISKQLAKNDRSIYCQEAALQIFIIIVPTLSYADLARFLPALQCRIDTRVYELNKLATNALAACAPFLQYADIKELVVVLKALLKKPVEKDGDPKEAVLSLLIVFTPLLKKEDLQALIPLIQEILLKVVEHTNYDNCIIFTAATRTLQAFAARLLCDISELLPPINLSPIPTINEAKLFKLKGLNRELSLNEMNTQFDEYMKQINSRNYQINLTVLSAFIPHVSYESRQHLLKKILQFNTDANKYVADTLNAVVPFLKPSDLQALLATVECQLDKQLERPDQSALYSLLSISKAILPFLPDKQLPLQKLSNLLGVCKKRDNYRLVLDIFELSGKRSAQVYINLLLGQLDHKSPWIFPLVMNKLLAIKPVINVESGRLIFAKISQFPQFFSVSDYFINFAVFADLEKLDRLLDKQIEFALGYPFIFTKIFSWLKEIKQSSLPEEFRNFYQQIQFMRWEYQNLAKKGYIIANISEKLYFSLKEYMDLFVAAPHAENYSLFKKNCSQAIATARSELGKLPTQEGSFLSKLKQRSFLFFNGAEVTKIFNKFEAIIEAMNPQPCDRKIL